MIDVEWWLGVALILCMGAMAYVAVTVGPDAAASVGYLAAIILLVASVLGIHTGLVD